MCLNSVGAFHQHLKTQSVADPGLPQTDEPTVTPMSAALCQINSSECDLPGPSSRDDDEDSLPLTQDLDLAKHIPCSNYDMTTFGHEKQTFTHSGFRIAILVRQSQLSGSTESCCMASKNPLSTLVYNLSGNFRFFYGIQRNDGLKQCEMWSWIMNNDLA